MEEDLVPLVVTVDTLRSTTGLTNVADRPPSSKVSTRGLVSSHDNLISVLVLVGVRLGGIGWAWFHAHAANDIYTNLLKCVGLSLVAGVASAVAAKILAAALCVSNIVDQWHFEFTAKAIAILMAVAGVAYVDVDFVSNFIYDVWPSEPDKFSLFWQWLAASLAAGVCTVGGVTLIAWVSASVQNLRRRTTRIREDRDFRAAHARLFQLMDDTDRYNRLVLALSVRDQLLVASAQKTSHADRAEVVRALTGTRERILTALRIDRVLRENSDILDAVDGSTALDAPGFEAMRVEQIGAEYQTLLNDTLAVARAVEESLNTISGLR